MNWQIADIYNGQWRCSNQFNSTCKIIWNKKLKQTHQLILFKFGIQIRTRRSRREKNTEVINKSVPKERHLQQETKRRRQVRGFQDQTNVEQATAIKRERKANATNNSPIVNKVMNTPLSQTHNLIVDKMKLVLNEWMNENGKYTERMNRREMGSMSPCQGQLPSS